MWVESMTDTENGVLSTDNKAYLKPPWKPGQSGNPLGRPPKGRSLTSLLREKTKNGKGKAIVDELIRAATDGNDWAIKYVLDRLDGKPTEKLSVTNEHVEQLFEIYTEAVSAVIDSECSDRADAIKGNIARRFEEQSLEFSEE